MGKKHLVKEGEYLSLIARRHGFVTNKPLEDANPALFAKRRVPEILNPGDVLDIPEKREKKVGRATTHAHSFKLKGQADVLRLLLRDQDGSPLPDQRFVLRVQCAADADDDVGLPIPGDLSGGKLTVPLPKGARKAFLTLEKTPWFSGELTIGGLDPTREPDAGPKLEAFVKGIQARLNNLGFHCGSVDGELGPRTKAALAEFRRQKMEGQDPEADLDEKTCEVLESEHAC